jgi:hypothetical protein
VVVERTALHIAGCGTGEGGGELLPESRHGGHPNGHAGHLEAPPLTAAEADSECYAKSLGSPRDTPRGPRELRKDDQLPDPSIGSRSLCEVNDRGHNSLFPLPNTAARNATLRFRIHGKAASRCASAFPWVLAETVRTCSQNPPAFPEWPEHATEHGNAAALVGFRKRAGDIADRQRWFRHRESPRGARSLLRGIKATGGDAAKAWPPAAAPASQLFALPVPCIP